MQRLFKKVGAVSIAALTLVAVAESHAQTRTSSVRDITSYGVCRDALNSQKTGWNQNRTYVAEAARRGLTVDACVHLITQASAISPRPTTPAKSSAQQAAQSDKDRLSCRQPPPPPCKGCSPYVAEKVRQKDIKRMKEAEQICLEQKREEAERKEAARRQQVIEEAKRKEEAERWRKAEQERQAAAAAAAAEAAKPINRLRRAYFNYIVVKKCYDVRLGYQLVYINEVEMQRARVAVKAIETSILKEDSTIDTNNTWQQATQLIEASKQYVEQYFCQKTYNDLMSAAPYSPPEKDFGTQKSADPTDLLYNLKNRESMVAAVAILSTLPPKCTIDQKSVAGESIARFVISYGHKGDDAFLADVKAKIQSNEEGFRTLSASDQAQVAEFICGFGVLLTAKVRDRQ